MRRFMLVGLLGVVVGCATAPLTERTSLAVSPDVAWQRAVACMARFGGEITAADSQARVLSARVHNAATLNASVFPQPDGSAVEVTGSRLLNKIAVGSFDEVATYSACLRQPIAVSEVPHAR